jgi:hypothetical protein
MQMGKIYYKGLNFTTQAVLVLALHIVMHLQRPQV